MTIERLLLVTADLTIEVGDDCVSVRAEGSSVVVEVPRASLAFQILRDLGSVTRVRDRIAGLSALLTRVGLTVVVRTPTRKLLTVGCDANSWLLRRFGVPNAKLHLS